MEMQVKTPPDQVRQAHELPSDTTFELDNERAIGELETFIHSDMPMPPLIKIGLIHSQFETIHPFLDGNGRMGRLLITFFLCQQGVLKRPLLYLSSFFKQNRD